MVGSIIEIILGYVIMEYIPRWIHVKSGKTNEIIRVLSCVVGIIMILSGIAALVRSFLGLF